MDSLFVSPNSGAVDLSRARNDNPAPPPPPVPPQHQTQLQQRHHGGSGNVQPNFRSQGRQSAEELERIATEWMLQRLSSGERAVDSPGKNIDTTQLHQRDSEELTADTDAPDRSQVEQHFKARRQMPRVGSQPSANQLLASESVGEGSLHRLTDSSEEENRRQATAIVSAVEALAVAHTQVAALTDEEQDLALIYAAARGYLTVVKKLVRDGVDTTAQDANGCTALTAAITRNHAAVVQYLMRQAPEVRIRPADGNRSDQQEVRAEQTISESTTSTTNTAETTRRETELRNALVYNIGNSQRVANRPESRWYGQSQAQFPDGHRDAD